MKWLIVCRTSVCASLVLWIAGETLAGASERRLQALISKRGRRGNNATAELNASFKAAQEATVSEYASFQSS